MDSLASIPAQAPDTYVSNPSPKAQILAIAGREIAEQGPCAFIEGHGWGRACGTRETLSLGILKLAGSNRREGRGKLGRAS